MSQTTKRVIRHLVPDLQVVTEVGHHHGGGLSFEVRPKGAIHAQQLASGGEDVNVTVVAEASVGHLLSQADGVAYPAAYWATLNTATRELMGAVCDSHNGLPIDLTTHEDLPCFVEVSGGQSLFILQRDGTQWLLGPVIGPSTNAARKKQWGRSRSPPPLLSS